MLDLSFVLNVLILWDDIIILPLRSIGDRECRLVCSFLLNSLKGCHILLKLVLLLKCPQQGVVHLLRLFHFLLELQLQLLLFVVGFELLESSIHLLLTFTQLQEHLLLLLDQLPMPCVFSVISLQLTKLLV